MKFRTCLNNTILTSSLLLVSSQTSLVHADALQEAISDGTASVNARYRYESVDDSTNLDAKASTLRTRLGFTTSTKNALSAHIDFETITRVLADPDYNSTANGQTSFAKVVDPSGTEVNQAFLKYVFSPEASVIAGRQRIILDNARFVGNVGWRQNEQTYDAIRVSLKPVKDISLELINIQQVNTITAKETETNHNLINAAFSGIGGGKLTSYAYLLENDGAPNSATSTLGLRYKGALDKFLYTVEYAKQSDSGDSTLSFDVDYILAELGYKIADNTKAFIAIETLGSDGGTVSFQTPLATKHAFNGWADKFLATPGTGLTDTYLKVVSKVAGIKLVGMYHDFSSDFGSTDYGTELDLLAVKKIDKIFTVLVKYASYSADVLAGPLSKDTDKIWLQLEMKLKQ